ncbi:porin family protein [Aquimarina longa]|uniref:porin family protein n=1 Tax=Aquimarina longa TaxID=1080221 RepID=UPI000781ECFC|nr:porin family protein [Aquimarina longa]
MIKNIFLTILIICITIPFSYAQEKEDDPLYTRAGFKAGTNYATIVGDTDVDARVRMHFGAVIEFPVVPRVFVQAELLYSAQGYKIKEEGIENKISLNYLMLPVIAKFNIIDKFSLETGPQLGTLANATESAKDTPKEFYDSFSNYDFSWVFGAGYKLESGLFFQVRYNLGLTNINTIETSNIDNKHSVAQLSVGYLFKTKNNRRRQQEQE